MLVGQFGKRGGRGERVTLISVLFDVVFPYGAQATVRDRPEKRNCFRVDN